MAFRTQWPLGNLKGGRTFAQVVFVPGLVASGEDTGTAAESWEKRGYFPSSGAELRVGYFSFQGPLTCLQPLPPSPIFLTSPVLLAQISSPWARLHPKVPCVSVKGSKRADFHLFRSD